MPAYAAKLKRYTALSLPHWLRDRTLTKAQQRERIKLRDELRILDAWRNVWACLYPRWNLCAILQDQTRRGRLHGPARLAALAVADRVLGNTRLRELLPRRPVPAGFRNVFFGQLARAEAGGEITDARVLAERLEDALKQYVGELIMADWPDDIAGQLADTMVPLATTVSSLRGDSLADELIRLSFRALYGLDEPIIMPGGKIPRPVPAVAVALAKVMTDCRNPGGMIAAQCGTIERALDTPAARALYAAIVPLLTRACVEKRVALVRCFQRRVVHSAIDHDSPISSLGLSERVGNALYNHGIRTIGQLLKMTAHAFDRVPQLRNSARHEVAQALQHHGFDWAARPPISYPSQRRSTH